MRMALAAAILLLANPLFAWTFSVPKQVVAEATGPAGAVARWNVTITTDVVDDGRGNTPPPPKIECRPESGSLFPLGVTTVECTASDATKSETARLDVVVVDTQPPVLTLPVDFWLHATTTEGALVDFTVSAVDRVDGARPVSCSRTPGPFPNGDTRVTCTASDRRGNTATGSFVVTVIAIVPPQPPPDPIPPMPVPAHITIEAAGPEGSVVTYVPEAGGKTLSCTPPPGSLFPVGHTEVTCTDGVRRGEFSVFVVDTVPPVLALPDDFSVRAASAGGAVVEFTATATDHISGNAPVTCFPASGTLLPVGTNHVSCTAYDTFLNSAHGRFAVTVLPPLVPELDLPHDFLVEGAGPGGTVIEFDARRADEGGYDANGNPLTTVTCTPSSGSLFPLGTTTVQCSDGVASGAFAVSVVDTTAPLLTLPARVTARATSSSDGAYVAFDASAVDAVDGSVAVQCTHASPSRFAIGIATVSCSAADARGNRASGSFEVEVTPSRPPRVVTVTASPDTIHDPDHRMVPVEIAVSIDDGSPFVAAIVRVFCSETTKQTAWVITGPLTLEVRADKSPQVKARVYAIDVEIVDDEGASYLERAFVTVTPPNASRRRRPTGRR